MPLEYIQALYHSTSWIVFCPSPHLPVLAASGALAWHSRRLIAGSLGVLSTRVTCPSWPPPAPWPARPAQSPAADHAPSAAGISPQ